MSSSNGSSNGHSKPTLAELDAWSRIDEPQPAPQRKRLLHADELDMLPAQEFLDEESELPSNAFAVIFGLSGGGKSFYALDKAYKQAQTRNVVYVAAEGASGYAARKNALRLHHKQDSGNLFFWPYAVNLLSPLEVQEFIAAIAHLEQPIVFLDTLARCMVGGDENSAKDMGMAIAACDTIRQATGQTVIVVHHTGKNGSSERGSSALRGAADVMIELQNDEGLITVSCSKMKDAKPFEDRKLRLIEAGESCVLVPSEKVITSECAPLNSGHRKVLEFLALAVFEDIGAKANQITCVPEGSKFRILSDLKKRGYLLQGAKGDPYTITDAGRHTISPPQVKPPAQQSTTNETAHPKAQQSLLSSDYQATIDSAITHHQSLSHSFRSDSDDSNADSSERSLSSEKQSKAVGGAS